jgi:hypothetical protein
LNSGIFLALLIKGSLFSVHVAGGYPPDQRAVRPQGKGDVQLPVVICRAQIITIYILRKQGVGGP